jgi:hypothetical protein
MVRAKILPDLLHCAEPQRVSGFKHEPLPADRRLFSRR